MKYGLQPCQVGGATAWSQAESLESLGMLKQRQRHFDEAEQAGYPAPAL